MSIHELRILPPLAIGRLGSAVEPLANYDLEIDPEDPLASRRIVPAPTFRLDVASGEITEAFVPETIRFKDGDAVRPVAPFLEVWARTSETTLEPLTAELLERHGCAPADLRWRVEVASLAIHRRTRVEDDRIVAAVGPFTDHSRHPLLGTCANFWPGKRLPFGWVQYVRPNDRFPGIRLRFTPGRGGVYGSSRTPPGSGEGRPGERLADTLYDGTRGSWLGHLEVGYPLTTVPARIYAREGDTGDNWNSIGYFDDKCDGIVRAELEVQGRTLTAYSRISASPPKYAPDSLPVRTVAHELEQALLGPEVRADEATPAGVEEIVRRAFESIRLVNTASMNGNVAPGREDVDVTLASQDRADTGRRFEPIMAPSLVDSAALHDLHRALLASLLSGTAPWFVDVLRRYDEVGDLTNSARRKMPALMRGSDGRHLALTRRQVDMIRQIARGPIFSDSDGGDGA